jgi:hypothetical protein
MTTRVGRSVRRIRRLRPRDVVEVATIVVLASYAEWLLARRPIADAARALGVALAASVATDHEELAPLPDWAARRVALTERTMRHWPRRDMCLRRSLVLANRLAPLRPQLVLGVRSAGDGIDAHAWVRVNGRDLDPLSRSYLAFEFA